MESTAFLALSKQVALEMRLANVANNLANVSTPGYRRMEMSFGGYMSRQHASAPIVYPVERPMRVDLTAGQALGTGNQLDLSISGNDRAFFVVARGNETFLTRAGALQLDQSGQGSASSAPRARNATASGSSMPAASAGESAR